MADNEPRLYTVRYNYNEDAETREKTLPSHEAFLKGLETEGKLALGGPLVDEPGVHALLILRATSVDNALDLLADDPMLSAGVLESRDVSGFIAAFGVL